MPAKENALVPQMCQLKTATAVEKLQNRRSFVMSPKKDLRFGAVHVMVKLKLEDIVGGQLIDAIIDMYLAESATHIIGQDLVT